MRKEDQINKEKPTWNFLGFIDDNATGETVEGDKIIGTLDDLILMKEKPLVPDYSKDAWKIL